MWSSTSSCLIIDSSCDRSKDPDTVTFLHVVLGDIVSRRISISNTYSRRWGSEIWLYELGAPGKSTKTAPVDKALALQRTLTWRMRGHKAGPSESVSFDLLVLPALLLAKPAAWRALSIRLGSLDFSLPLLSLSFLPRFWSLESMYFAISLKKALESLAEMVLVVPRMREISIMKGNMGSSLKIEDSTY